jgi:hypothetical protein
VTIARSWDTWLREGWGSMIENEFLSYRISKHANSFNFGFY